MHISNINKLTIATKYLILQPDCETAESSSEGKAVLQNVKVNTKEVVGGPEFDNVRYRLDCHSCLLVEIGERANYLGLPCDTCGRKPR